MAARRAGQSPFVWSVIGVLPEVTRLPITTAVTCPTVRTHPAIIAHAAATAAVQCEGRFALGVGSGEALDEHILGDPPGSVRRRRRWRAGSPDQIELTVRRDRPPLLRDVDRRA